MGREFNEFYKKERRKPSKIIDQYNYFEKAVHGMLSELKQMMVESENGVHLKGFGVLYKKPFGILMHKISLFAQKKKYRRLVDFYLEDDFLRREYLIAEIASRQYENSTIQEDKATAILLHRKLKLKK